MNPITATNRAFPAAEPRTPPGAPVRPAVLSVNAATAAAQPGVRSLTGIGKRAVDQIEVVDPGPKRSGPAGSGYSGVRGDFIGSGRHHGGSGQAVYAVAREELEHWSRELGRDLPNGMFGENLTTTGLDVDAAECGDRWTVGTAVLRVSGPRVPCATFARHMGERGWLKRFGARGRAGCYLAVERPGSIRPGDGILVRPFGSGLRVTALLQAWLGDLDQMRLALRNADLDEESRARFAAAVARRG